MYIVKCIVYDCTEHSNFRIHRKECLLEWWIGDERSACESMDEKHGEIPCTSVTERDAVRGDSRVASRVYEVCLYPRGDYCIHI